MPLFPNSARRQSLLWLLGLGGMLLGGCQTTDRITVDALSRPAAAQTASYRLITSNREIDQTSLRYHEAIGYVKTALAAKGLYEAPDPKQADMVIDVDYGMSDPKSRIETISHPHFELQDGAVYVATVRTGTAANGTPIYQRVIVQNPPQYVYTGDSEQQVTVVTYEKFLSLSARENRPSVEGQPAEEIWTVNITSEGSSRDLRKAVPVMAAAAIDYIGKETNGEQTVHLKEDDGAVEFVKQAKQ